jgi:hypothetical protein
MNAGGVPNTCKSNVRMLAIASESGERVSNTWVTCRAEGDNHWKRWLIPHGTVLGGPEMVKTLVLREGPASD